MIHDDVTDAELRDLLTVVLDACRVPTADAMGNPATMKDRLHDLGVRYQHAILLASLANAKLQADTTPIPTKEGDRMPVAMAWISQHFTEQIEAIPEAKNYLSWGWTDGHTGKAYYVTIQREGGKTPAQIAAESRVDLSKAKARIAELEQHIGSLHKATQRGREYEREQVVAHIRKFRVDPSAKNAPHRLMFKLIADAIERGDHDKDDE